MRCRAFIPWLKPWAFPHGIRKVPFPPLAPSLDKCGGAFLFASVDTAGREASRCDRYIGAWSGDTRLVQFAFSGYFALFANIFTPFLGIVR